MGKNHSQRSMCASTEPRKRTMLTAKLSVQGFPSGWQCETQQREHSAFNCSFIFRFRLAQRTHAHTHTHTHTQHRLLEWERVYPLPIEIEYMRSDPLETTSHVFITVDSKSWHAYGTFLMRCREHLRLSNSSFITGEQPFIGPIWPLFTSIRHRESQIHATVECQCCV